MAPPWKGQYIEYKKILLYQWVTYIYKKDATHLPIRKFHYQQEQYSQIPVWLTGVYYAFLASSQEKMPLCWLTKIRQNNGARKSLHKEGGRAKRLLWKRRHPPPHKNRLWHGKIVYIAHVQRRIAWRGCMENSPTADDGGAMFSQNLPRQKPINPF